MDSKILNIAKLILLVVIIFTFGYAIYGQLYLTNERTDDLSFCKPLDTVWYRINKDGSKEQIELPRADTIDGNIDIIETVLYDTIDKGACISIRSSKQDIKVYIDDVLRESYSTSDTRLFGKTSASKYLFIELDKDDAGKVMRIEITSESRYLGTVKQVYYGDKLGIWFNYIKSNIISLIIPVISLIVSLVALVVGAVYYFKTKKPLSVFYYALAVMLISVWILCISSVRQLMFNNVTVIHDISMVLSVLYVVPFAIYINHIQKERYKILYSIYVLFALLYCIGSNALAIYGVADTSDISPYDMVVIAIGMLLCVKTMALDIKRKKIGEYKEVVFGFLFLIGTGIVQMVMYFEETRTFDGNAISIGVLVSLLVSIIHSIVEIKKVSDEKNTLQQKISVNALKIEALTYQALETLANTIDAKDNYTKGHSNRVAKYSKEIAKRLGKSDNEAINIYFMGLLHDIGKIGVRDEILNKTKKLTAEEFEVIKNHPAIGYDILKNMTEIPNIEYGARWHHERYDGSGYPDGLAGEKIPEYARIICVADAYDAMTSTRSYRTVMTQEKVRSEIINGMGKQFDPVIAQVMLEMIDEDTEYKMKE